MTQSVKKQANMRHAEYYDQQEIQDDLYAKSKNGEVFGHLMDTITSPENIKLAYRNIKKNVGSHTAGTDGKTIEFFANMEEDKFVMYIQKQFTNYQPKMVKRVEIPKPNGKMRPLGIPCITDRIVQQCILQVLEPVCEAKFYDHSYGFRPNRSAENAIAYAETMMQLGKQYYVVDVDIKGFFDNVNHRKLMRQLWTMGIHDTKLLQIIKAMLKAPIRMPDGKIEYPDKGTPQGGILSPLLANVVLNELDWWIASQWELQCDHLRNQPKVYYSKKGSRNKGHEYTVLRSTSLKEMHIVRYADDFKILCANRKDALKAFIAVKQWLRERLHLEISEEKSKVTNLKRHYSEFLGFKLKVRSKGNKYVVRSHMTDKAIKSTKEKLSMIVKDIQKPKDNKQLYKEIARYNSTVMGIQNYYCIATSISADLGDVAYDINILMKNRIEGLKKEGQISNQYIRLRYGKSRQMRWANDYPIVPIGYTQHRAPMSKKLKVNRYTPEGRAEVHENLGIDVNTMLWLMRHPIRERSVEYNDNRISLYAAQYGKCAITGEKMEVDDIHCHHKVPRWKKGTDAYGNLVLTKQDVHRLIHATKAETIAKYTVMLNLDSKQIKKVNQLRALAGLEAIA